MTRLIVRGMTLMSSCSRGAVRWCMRVSHGSTDHGAPEQARAQRRMARHMNGTAHRTRPDRRMQGHPSLSRRSVVPLMPRCRARSYADVRSSRRGPQGELSPRRATREPASMWFPNRVPAGSPFLPRTGRAPGSPPPMADSDGCPRRSSTSPRVRTTPTRCTTVSSSGRRAAASRSTPRRTRRSSRSSQARTSSSPRRPARASRSSRSRRTRHPWPEAAGATTPRPSRRS